MYIEFLGVKPHRLDEKLVARLILKGHYLCLDARAVAGADALDNAGVYRAAVDVIKNDLMRFFVRVGKIANRLVLRRRCGLERKALRLGVALLKLHF